MSDHPEIAHLRQRMKVMNDRAQRAARLSREEGREAERQALVGRIQAAKGALARFDDEVKRAADDFLRFSEEAGRAQQLIDKMEADPRIIPLIAAKRQLSRTMERLEEGVR